MSRYSLLVSRYSCLEFNCVFLKYMFHCHSESTMKLWMIDENSKSYMDDDGSTTYCSMTTYCNMTTYCRTMIISSLSSFLPVLDSWLPVVRQCRDSSLTHSRRLSRPFPRFVRIIILSYASLYLSMLSLYSSYCIYTVYLHEYSTRT